MSEFRFEKQRVSATLILAPGTSVSGSFFVAGQTSNHRLGAEYLIEISSAEYAANLDRAPGAIGVEAVERKAGET